LRPARQTRPHSQSPNRRAGLIDRQKRARSYKRHFADRVEKLRKFIEAQATKQAPKTGQAFRIGQDAAIPSYGWPHGAEFEDVERSAARTWTLLPENSRGAEMQTDNNENQIGLVSCLDTVFALVYRNEFGSRMTTVKTIGAPYDEGLVAKLLETTGHSASRDVFGARRVPRRNADGTGC
jgi:hypothetical protein